MQIKTHCLCTGVTSNLLLPVRYRRSFKVGHSNLFLCCFCEFYSVTNVPELSKTTHVFGLFHAQHYLPCTITTLIYYARMDRYILHKCRDFCLSLFDYSFSLSKLSNFQSVVYLHSLLKEGNVILCR